jgi:hypothetical protein
MATDHLLQAVRAVLFWYFMQRRIVVSYRRFGTACRSLLQGSSSLLGLLAANISKLAEQYVLHGYGNGA